MTGSLNLEVYSNHYYKRKTKNKEYHQSYEDCLFTILTHTNSQYLVASPCLVCLRLNKMQLDLDTIDKANRCLEEKKEDHLSFEE